MNRRSVLRTLLAAALPCAAVLLTGCATAYYGTMEKFGVHKRDIMADRVKDGRESQQDAKKQFANALEQFKSVVKAPGGSLEDKYNKLNGEYERCKARAQEVSDRIDSIERVSKDLFAEWRAEIKQYANPDLARRSQEQYDRSQALYAPMIAAMRRAETTMKPVLTAFHDQVLFLKHNLNAQSIASLKGELAGLETNIAALIRDMEASIREADGFLAGFGAGSK